MQSGSDSEHDGVPLPDGGDGGLHPHCWQDQFLCSQNGQNHDMTILNLGPLPRMVRIMTTIRGGEPG